ncbi:TPA: phosphotransferase [Photobacterium damselae]
MNKPQLLNIAKKAYLTMFNTQAEVCDIQETFYGWIVFLVGSKGKIVVKFSKEVGRIAKEANALKRLRTVADCAVPSIYFFGRDEGYDYLALEWIDGVSASELPKEHRAIKIFSESYSDILVALHEHHNDQGFECNSESFTPDFINAFDQWTMPLHRFIQSSGSPFSGQERDQFGQLWEMRETLLDPIRHTESSLIHDDCNLANVLFDPKTYKAIALLDPCDMGFKHREMDLIHLNHYRSDVPILDCYIEKSPLTENYLIRQEFFRLWDDAKHCRNTGWYNNQWFSTQLSHFIDVVR